MAKEIEHKFLVKKKLLPNFKKMKIFCRYRKMKDSPDIIYYGCREMTQGYISRSPVVRIRIEKGAKDAGGDIDLLGLKEERAVLTIKGKGCRVRDEFEFPIEMDDAEKMMKLCGKRKIRKVRHYLGPWEIDFFKGVHKGLILAEIELKSSREKLPELPEWIGEEVTYDPCYSNASLSEPDAKIPK